MAAMNVGASFALKQTPELVNRFHICKPGRSKHDEVPGGLAGPTQPTPNAVAGKVPDGLRAAGLFFTATSQAGENCPGRGRSTAARHHVFEIRSGGDTPRA